MTATRENILHLAEAPVVLESFNSLTIGSPLAVGTIAAQDTNANGGARRVIFDLSTFNEKDMSIGAQSLNLPNTISATTAPFVPPLFFALRIWDRLKLNLGETAIISGRSLMTSILTQVAEWHGAVTIRISDTHDELIEQPNRMSLNSEASERCERILKETIAQRPGVAMADFSGRASIVDLLLEVIPFWGRLMFCSPYTEPLTIDYYRNLHRSGAIVLPGIIDTRKLLEMSMLKDDRQTYQRALNIASKEDLFEELQNFMHLENTP